MRQVKELLGITEKDWWFEISEAEKASIKKGIEELDRGEAFPHEEVMKRVNERFFKKK